MQGFEADYITEPILWLIAALLFFQLGLYFFTKYLKSEKEARAFFSGAAVFMFSYAIIRTIEVIRRYFVVGYYYDIEDFWYHGGSITDTSLYLRLAFLIISWIGIAYFYYRIESTILEKKTYYILTIAALLKLVINPMLYFPSIFNFNTFMIINSILFVICGFFPVVLFAYYALRNYVNKRGPWALLAVGLLCYIVGEIGSNPEAYLITSNMNQIVVHYGSPLLVILGGILLTLALRRLYEIGVEAPKGALPDDQIKKLQEKVVQLKYIIVIMLVFLAIAFSVILYYFL